MAFETTYFVTAILEVARKKEELRGPERGTEEEAKADLDELRESLGSGEWINLDWISANPKNIAAAVLQSETTGFEIL